MTGCGGNKKGSEHERKFGERPSLVLGAFELFSYFSASLALISSLQTTSIWSPLTVLEFGSCAALTHAWPQHQSTLLRNLWVFYHALPNSLFLPVRVHPVHFISIAFTLRRKRRHVCFTLLGQLKSPEDINIHQTLWEFN